MRLGLRFIRASLCTPPPRVLGFALFESPRSNPPLLEGRLDFPKSPRSNPPLPEGRLDFPKSPRSHPPLLEGWLDLLGKSKVWSNPPRVSKRPSKSAASGRKMRFSSDFQVSFMGFSRAWRVDLTF